MVLAPMPETFLEFINRLEFPICLTMVDNILSSFATQSFDLLEFFQTGLIEIDLLFLAR